MHSSDHCSRTARCITSCHWCSGHWLFGSKELSAQRGRIAWARETRGHLHRAGRAADCRRPHLPRRQPAAVLRRDPGGPMSDWLSSTSSCRSRCWRFRIWWGASWVWACWCWRGALFRRVQAAYHISVWLLVAGIFASLLKGTGFRRGQACWRLGPRGAHARAACFSIARPRSSPSGFTPVWVVSIGRRDRHGGVDRHRPYRHVGLLR